MGDEMTFRTFHLCLDVRGAMRAPKRMLASMCLHDDGRRMTADEAWNALASALAEGKERLPIGDCDDFDFKTGCRGHPKAPLPATVLSCDGAELEWPITNAVAAATPTTERSDA